MRDNRKTVDQKLYEAFYHSRGVRLTSSDIDDLLTCDDAIQTRLTNQAAIEAGAEEPGASPQEFGSITWKKLGEIHKEPAP